MTHSIRHDANTRRFVTEVDGQTAYVEYERQGDTLAITHTIVPSAIGGRGIAGNLVRDALEHARQNGLKVKPRCSYAASYIDKHPEYADLRAGN